MKKLSNKAEKIMQERFGKDSVILQATAVGNIPYVRSVNVFYEEGAFYVLMLTELKKRNYEKASLSVQKENYAVRMYLNLGFEIIEENKEEYIMIYNFNC